MKRSVGILPAVFLFTLIGGSAGTLEAQDPSGSVVMRSENIITWWVVDPSSGVAAFYGGDIIQICSDDPEGHDLLDFQEVHQPNEVAFALVAKGDDIGSSLWDHPPPFIMPRLCHDILSRDGPMATGTADITVSGRFITDWDALDAPGAVSTFGMTARGTMQTPDGATLRVDSRYRCAQGGGERRCTQGVDVR